MEREKVKTHSLPSFLIPSPFSSLSLNPSLLLLSFTKEPRLGMPVEEARKHYNINGCNRVGVSFLITEVGCENMTTCHVASNICFMANLKINK
jgi:hypothetical protein